MPCVTIMIIIKLIKTVNHVDIFIPYIYDTLKYTFHLALSSPIKISVSYITCSHIIELKLEIKLIYSLHLNGLLNFLRDGGRTHCMYCPKSVTSRHSRRRQWRPGRGLCDRKARLQASAPPPPQHPQAVASLSAFVFQLYIRNNNNDTLISCWWKKIILNALNKMSF